MITKEELARLLELPAGVELDWHIEHLVFDGDWVDFHSHTAFVDRNGEVVPVPPAYSTTGDGMLAVIEHLRPRFRLATAEQYSGWPSIEYFTSFQTKRGARHFIGAGETLPLAVCRAALKAVAQERS